MSTWTSDELERIAEAEELEIASVRRDGTQRKPVTIWVARHGAEARHEAHIEAGGVGKDVLLVETDDMNDEIDAAYRAKYRRYAESIVGSIVSPNARAATLKLVPR